MDGYRIRIADESDLVAAREAVTSLSSDPALSLSVEELRTEPVEGEPERLVEPVTAILVGAGVVALSQLVKEWWKRARGGLVIDLQPGAIDMFRRDRALEFGYVATV
jgi:hypothetical protein